MANLVNHPGFWLRDDAARAFNAAEAKYGKFVVNSAGRTVSEQQKLIDRWNRGGASNRPPYLYYPANPPEKSNHVSNGGIAVDLADWRRFAAIATEFGFSHPHPGGDPVHFEYNGGYNPDAEYKVNTDIRDKQRFLNQLGWTLVEDGSAGPLTIQAFKEYQTVLKNAGWYSGEIDGRWGPATEAAHQKDLSTRPVTYLRIQKGLNHFGYNLVEDGLWGPKSSNALADFQAKNGLKVDRIVGPLTREALGI